VKGKRASRYWHVGIILTASCASALGCGPSSPEEHAAVRAPEPPRAMTRISATDEDEDGVANSLDQCSKTPKGAKVWTGGAWAGCAGGQYKNATDSDRDGVVNTKDACPGTPWGAGVDATGCPLPDSDGDGVPDVKDLCSETPAGAAVWTGGDWLGCAGGQLKDSDDTDRDGVANSADQCPQTPSGAVVDATGCPAGTSTPAPGPACASVPPRDCTGGDATCAQLGLFWPTQTDTYVATNGTAFSTLRRDTTMLVKYAAASVACLLPGSYPLGLGDMSMADGSMPKDNGSPRHPAGSHDYGRDIDMAYFQLGAGNNYLNPVCEHTSGGVEQYHCTGYPSWLDVPRTTLFIAKLFESDRVRVIGVDGQIGALLKAQAQQLYQAGTISAEVLGYFTSKLGYEPTNTGNGWYYYHHHHMHMSTWTTTYASYAAEAYAAYQAKAAAKSAASSVPLEQPRLAHPLTLADGELLPARP